MVELPNSLGVLAYISAGAFALIYLVFFVRMISISITDDVLFLPKRFSVLNAASIAFTITAITTFMLAVALKVGIVGGTLTKNIGGMCGAVAAILALPFPVLYEILSQRFKPKVTKLGFALVAIATIALPSSMLGVTSVASLITFGN